MTGNENHSITLSDAAKMTKAYRQSITAGSTIAHAFGKSAIQAILNQSGVVGVRIYYGLNEEGEKQLIVVGTDTLGNDLYTGLLAERSLHCPEDCSSANPLNSDTAS